MSDCNRCGGDGVVPCPDCNGKGGREVERYKDGEVVGTDWSDCVGCDGQGVIDCPACQ